MMVTNSTANTEHPAYGLRKAIAAVKDAVEVEDYAAGLTELRPAGNTQRGWCPVHAGSSPDSFAVYTAERRWYCFRCCRGGDVIDLCRAVEGGELQEIVYLLARRFGVELPTRYDFWHTRQDEKSKTREAAKKHVAGVYQRRLTRLYTPLVLVGGESPEEELEHLEGLSSALWPISLDMATRRVNDE